MKIYEKQLPSKENLIPLILDETLLKGLRVIKIHIEIKFEGAWCESEAKNCFKIQ